MNVPNYDKLLFPSETSKRQQWWAHYSKVSLEYRSEKRWSCETTVRKRCGTMKTFITESNLKMIGRIKKKKKRLTEKNKRN